MTAKQLNYYHADGRLVMIKNSDLRGLTDNKIDILNYNRMVEECKRRGGKGKLTCCHVKYL